MHSGKISAMHFRGAIRQGIRDLLRRDGGLHFSGAKVS
jgi:hypothetical protein